MNLLCHNAQDGHREANGTEPRKPRREGGQGYDTVLSKSAAWVENTAPVRVLTQDSRKVRNLGAKF